MTDRSKISKLILMLGSSHDGEVVAAVRALERTLKAEKLDFHWLAKRLTTRSPAPVAVIRTRPMTPDAEPVNSWKTMSPTKQAAWVVALGSFAGLSAAERGIVNILRGRINHGIPFQCDRGTYRIMNRVVYRAQCCGVSI